MLATFWSEVWQAMSQEPLSFLIGAVFGFAARGRYKFVRTKINGKKEDE